MPETQESKKVLNLERAAEMWQATKDYVATHAAQPAVTSGTEDEAAWLQRETAGGFPCGGRATVRSIKGHSEVVDGSLQSAHPTGIESEDGDGNALGGISIPIDTLAPNGLRSAGSAYDELTETEVITRIASANLGDRTWNAYSSGAGNTYYCNLTGSVPVKAGGLDNLISAEHALGTSSTALADGEMIGGSTNNRVYIRDDSCLTADAMKTARAGEIIYYEMETPTTVTIDPPIPMTYRCEAGGTETVTHTEATSAPTLDVVYEIDGTAAAASIAPLEGRIASTNYSLGSLLMLGGTLVKVTTPIATGESIVIGQNVEATTVAAELAALA